MNKKNEIQEWKKQYCIDNDEDAKVMLDGLNWNKDGGGYVKLQEFIEYCRREGLEVNVTESHCKHKDYEHVSLALEVVFEEV